MANWVDFLVVGIILSILIGVGFAALTLTGKVQDAVKTTKASLGDKGVNISASGISVKTDKRLDREAYLDATQRSMVNAVKAASFGGPSPEGRKSFADIDKSTKPAPSSPQEQGTARKRSFFGKSKAKASQ